MSQIGGFHVASGCVLLGVCLSLPASAATLDAIQGQVLINHGEGFQRVAAATEAREGDLIIAKPGGSAKLIYPGGCVTEVKPGTVVTVNDGSKCPQAMLLGEDCANSTDPNVRARCRCRDSDSNDDKDLRPRCGFVWWPLAVGAAIPLTGFLISTNTDNAITTMAEVEAVKVMPAVAGRRRRWRWWPIPTIPKYPIAVCALARNRHNPSAYLAWRFAYRRLGNE